MKTREEAEPIIREVVFRYMPRNALKMSYEILDALYPKPESDRLLLLRLTKEQHRLAVLNGEKWDTSPAQDELLRSFFDAAIAEEEKK